jgi:hypothetical protein
MYLIFAGRQTSGTLHLQRVNLSDEIASLANTYLQHLFCVEPAQPGSTTRPTDNADAGPACAESAAGVS